jgi:hypothetical protein
MATEKMSASSASFFLPPPKYGQTLDEKEELLKVREVSLQHLEEEREEEFRQKLQLLENRDHMFFQLLWRMIVVTSVYFAAQFVYARWAGYALSFTLFFVGYTSVMGVVVYVIYERDQGNVIRIMPR